MNDEPGISKFSDDPEELDYKTYRLLRRAIREGWEDWSMKDVRKKAGEKFGKWLDGVGADDAPISNEEIKIVHRIGELSDRIENTQLRKYEIADKTERLDSGKPTENVGVQRIVMDKPPEGWKNPLDDD